MMYITEWKPTFDTQAFCGHLIKAGQKACKLTISVCQDDVVCLPQAIKAGLNAQQQSQKPSFLYHLWHWLFGAKPKKPAVQHDLPPRMRKCAAKQEVRLDCGHTVKAGSLVWESRTYTCEQEYTWPLAVLSACLRFLQQEQAASQPDSVNKTQAAQNGSNNGQNQPYAYYPR